MKPLSLSLLLFINFVTVFAFAEAVLPKVRCHVSFRKNPYIGPVEPFKTIVIDAQKDLIWKNIPHGDFLFALKYDQNLSDGHFIKIYVWPIELKSPHSNDSISEIWYPLPDQIGDINFSLSGFTGLHYVYHPVKKSELQYACEYLR